MADGLRCYQAETMGKTRMDAGRNEFRAIASHAASGIRVSLEHRHFAGIGIRWLRFRKPLARKSGSLRAYSSVTFSLSLLDVQLFLEPSSGTADILHVNCYTTYATSSLGARLHRGFGGRRTLRRRIRRCGCYRCSPRWWRGRCRGTLKCRQQLLSIRCA